VSDLYVLELASRASAWLSQRQALIAENVANATTPGFRAKDLPPFSPVLDQSSVTLASTNPGHMTIAAPELEAAREIDEASPEETISGNSVELENEMVKLGDVSRAYTLDNNIKRAIHQMLLSVLK